MTSNGWAEALLVAVLLAPLASVVLAVAVAVPAEDRRWTTGGCALAAVGATVLLVTGQHPHVSRLAPDDLALAASAATALLAVGARASARTPFIAASVTVVICGVATGTPTRPSTVGAVLAMAGATALVSLTRDSGRLTIATISAGVVVAAVGLHAGHHSGVVAVVVGAAVVAIAAGLSTRRATTVLVPIALVLGLRVAPELTDTATARSLAVALAVAGAALAVLPAIAPGGLSYARVVALVPWTLAAAVGPVAGLPAAARALGAGCVLALALGGPIAMLAAVPAVAMVAIALGGAQGWPRLALAVLAIVTAIGLTANDGERVAPRPRPVDAVVGLATAWFVIRPTSWSWTRVAGLQAYSDGTLLAAASALIAGVVLAMTGARLAPEAVVPWALSHEESDTTRSARGDTATLAAVALMGVATAALLRSARL